MGLLTGPGRSEVAPEPADRLVLKKFHSARYLHVLKEASEGHWDAEAINMGLGTSDCPIFKDMYDYSVWACGATLTGAKLILSDEVDIAFNLSGGLHHAGPELASGFCYINDMALACLTLAEEGKKVLYLDVDVHFGDGVAHAFYGRSDVITISFHESGRTLFPGTGFEDEIGTGKGKGYCVNVPLPVGTYDEAYMMAFKAIAVPLIGAYNPDVIVFELGVDALAGDPLAHLQLTNNTYVEIIKHLLKVNKPILAAGGGGYHIGNTVRAWALAWSVFCGASDDQDMNLAAGGVLLESTDWQGGLQDRTLAISNQQRDFVMPQVQAVIETVKANVFPFHHL
jgi:acetoin utilization protein AcuC